MNNEVMILLMICSGVFTLILKEYGTSIFEALIMSFITFTILGFMISWIYS